MYKAIHACRTCGNRGLVDVLALGGSLTPGTGLPIVPEDETLARRPDYLLVLPWHFREHFLQSPKLRGVHLVFPLPKLEVVRVQ